MESSKQIGFWTGLMGFAAVLALPTPEGLSPEGWDLAAIAVLMAIWWVSETLPLAVVALIPIILFPLMDVSTLRNTTTPYAEPVIYLFMGGFIMAKALERWNLHKRIALFIVKTVGNKPNNIVLGFMLASAFLSMWVSNTATVIMMIPIAMSLVSVQRHELSDVVSQHRIDQKHFLISLLLGIAYSASIGGLATLIGTPPNALLAGFLSSNYQITVGFTQWMKLGIPLVVIALPILYLLMNKVIFKVSADFSVAKEDEIANQWRDLGRISGPEIRVATIVILTALAWVLRPMLSEYVSGLSDTGIAIACSVLLFGMPSGSKEQHRILVWEDCKSLPFEILILFGGGLTLAKAITDTGLAAWIANQAYLVENVPDLVLILLIVFTIIFLTEVSSNTATAATFIPLLYAIALELSINPFMIVIPATLATSCAFMLPVATPPNAIAYASGQIKIKDMVRAGFWLNLIMTLLCVGISYLLVPIIFP
jgi:sodium-dependent dicarboxylate transporter 2/3/5